MVTEYFSNFQMFTYIAKFLDYSVTSVTCYFSSPIEGKETTTKTIQAYESGQRSALRCGAPSYLPIVQGDTL